MKTLSASILALLLTTAASPVLRAQEAGSGFGLTPSKPDTLLPDGQPVLPLIPNALPAPEKSRVAPEQKSKTDVAEDALRDLIKMRAARNKAAQEPDLQALWDTIPKAKTDNEQRALFTKYYTMLFERMGKFDKTITPDALNGQRDRYISNFNQNRVTRTPAPAASPVPAATPASTGKSKGKSKQAPAAAPAPAPAPADAPAPAAAPAGQ